MNTRTPPFSVQGNIGPGSVGIDEAGRGCLAGPVVAGAVCFPAGLDVERLLPGLGDSKKLTQKRRDALAPLIRRHALWGVGFSWPGEIDRRDILRATFLAMTRATLALLRRGNVDLFPFGGVARVFPQGEGPKRPSPIGKFPRAFPNEKTQRFRMPLCIDGNQIIPEAVWSQCSALPLPLQQAIVGGDGRVPVISAASVLAKTARDALMIRLDSRFPGYGFATHKGYGTREHLAALREFGPCSLHRKTFRKVRPEEVQGRLFP